MYLKYNYLIRFIMEVCYISFSFYSFLLDSISSTLLSYIIFLFSSNSHNLLIKKLKFLVPLSIVQSLYFLNPKFQASSHLLWLCSPVCVGPGRKPRRPVFSQRGSYNQYMQEASEDRTETDIKTRNRDN